MIKGFSHRWLLSLRAHWPFYLFVLLLMVLCWQLWAGAPKDLSKVLHAIEKAHAAGETARVEEYAQAWLPRLGKVFFFVCGALAALGPWLIGSEKEVPLARAVLPANRGLWLLTGLLILASAVMNGPRLYHSFWGDEEATARRLVIGEFRADEQGQLKLRKPNWTKTLFFYNDPNNHPLFSALARISDSLVSKPTAKKEFYFREWPIRLPSFLFGLAGLAALAWLASGMGLARAGMFAVMWSALHPWYVRYGVDARGYGLLMALLPLCMGFLWRGVQQGRMIWWLGYGITEGLVLWAYPGALYFVFLMNVAACGMLLTCAPPTARWLQWRRFSTANLLGAMITALALAPCIQPMMLYLKRERIRGDLTGDWALETISGLFTGLPWANWAEHEYALSWMRSWQQAPLLVAVVLGLLVITLILGALAMWQRGASFRWMLGLILGTGPFMMGLAKLQGNILYPWYLIVCLPGLAIVFALGLDFLTVRLGAGAKGLAVCTAVLGTFAIITWPQAQLLRQHPTEQMRESVMATRAERNPLISDASRVLTATIMYPVRLYDPTAVTTETVEKLQQLMHQADETKRPLFINFANPTFLRIRYPELAAVLGDKSKFNALPPFLGVDGQPERFVYSYKGQH